MQKYAVKLVVINSLFLLSSCLVTQSAKPVSALLTQPSAQSRLILENAIGSLLNSQPVALADNIFTEKSIVIIESNQPKDNQGKLLDGRDIRQSETFSLLTEDGKCYIKHNQSGKINLLNKISCKAE